MSGFGAGGGSFGSPFGSSPFGNPLQQQQQPNVGSSSTTNSFDSRQQPYPLSGSFGSAPASFGSKPAEPGGLSFGTSPHVTHSQFGTGTNTTQLSQGAFAPGATTLFGQTQANAGSSWNAQGGFSSSITPFGSSSTVSFAAPASMIPFGSASASTPFTKQLAPTTPFLNANQLQPQAPFGFTSTPSTPFGSSNAAAMPLQQKFTAGSNTSTAINLVSFGVSSNVANFSSPTATGHMTGNPHQHYHYHQDDSDMASSPIPYGQERDMAANQFEPPTGAQAARLHFGQPDTVDRVWQRPLSDQQKETKSLNANAAVFTPFGGAQLQREGHDDGDKGYGAPEETSEDKLAKLKAKIEEKKRRLLDKRKKEQSSNSNPESESNGATPPPQPTALAQRNALRFAQSQVTKTDEEERRIEKSASTHHMAYTTSSGIAATEREDLQNAVSLVGTCTFMCPEEELHRRQAENDIQLLELPRPGTLHPSNWTLRDTAVKRFRRSAADYKLDVPEWVRPPDVLERVIGYLEEWVMERDRQGGDPRFPNGGVPPSLDVYQFIWDRTRMIRKDFILQNYVGTGGMCDARAVRCHERIARWHAMCEHQLSHIPDFVKAQSQQNISELGQTLKSLNQFYDDSLNRSLIEVANEHGQEMRTDLRQCNHGCELDIVQGRGPVDYDGTPLVNCAEDAAHQLIGKHAIHSLNHGTAEAEMRGLYILLTIDNDGGMEVLKYAARLYSERSEIYHSEHVQLAMTVYKARREYNYARFFSILRSPKTPYLFACLMFKHVEVMRKLAFRIMSRTYGARGKDNEAIYDAYPLTDLMELLCFESLEEAQKACEHFGITVKPMKVRTATGDSVEEIVFWRQSSYREPTDEEKGIVVPLPPWKMVKTIENKRQGASRLAVCRGQVSGGSNLLNLGQVARVSTGSSTQVHREDNKQNDNLGIFHEHPSDSHHHALGEALEMTEMAVLERDRREAEERVLREKEAKTRIHAENEARRQAEEEEARIRAEKEAHAEAIRQEEERKAVLEREAQMRRQAKERARQIAEAEARRKAEAARAAEEKLQREVELKVKQEAEDRMRRELEAQSRRRAEALAKREEARRAALAAAERKRILEAQEREEQYWQQRRSSAKKILTLGRWLQTLPKYVLDDGLLHMLSTRLSIESLFAHPKYRTQDLRQQFDDAPEFHLRRSLEACLKTDTHIPIAKLVCLDSFGSGNDRPMTALLVVALLMPICDNDEQQALCDLVRIWIASRVQSDRYLDNDRDVRVAIVNPGSSSQSCAIDAVLALDLGWRGTAAKAPVSYVEPHAPAVVLKLLPGENVLNSNVAAVSPVDLMPEALEMALEESMHHVASQLRRIDPLYLEKVPLGTICYMLGYSIVDAAHDIERRDDLLGLIQLALHCVIDYLDEVAVSLTGGPAWPSSAFASGAGVKDYFGRGQDLPLDWLSSFRKVATAPFVADLSACLTGSVEDAIRTLLLDAPEFVRQQSRFLLQRRQFRSALKLSFRWRQENTEEPPYLYIPRGTLGAILEETTARAQVRIEEQYPSVNRRRELEHSHSIEWADGVSDSRDDSATNAEASLVLASDVGDVSSPASPSASKRRRDTESVAERRSPIDRPPSSKKTRRQEPESPVSEEVRESRAFTRKLEAFLAGTETKDMVVGTRPLSSYLRKAPRVILP